MAICDICGSATGPDRTDVSSNLVKEFVNAGFYPGRHSKAMAFAQGSAFGDSVILTDPSGDRIEVDTKSDSDRAKIMWAMTVAVNTSDWALCTDCLGEMAAFERNTGFRRGIDKKWRNLRGSPACKSGENTAEINSGNGGRLETILLLLFFVGVVGAIFYLW